MSWGRLLAGPVLAALVGLAATLCGWRIGARRCRDCATPPEMTDTDIKLPHLAERLAAHKPATIVAIGGASTIGKAAGSPDLSYPHRLEQDLARDFPEATRSPWSTRACRSNRRSTCSIASPTDVFASRPGACRLGGRYHGRGARHRYRRLHGTLQDGLDVLKNKAIDTILVDMQFSPSSATRYQFRSLSEGIAPRRRPRRTYTSFRASR